MRENVCQKINALESSPPDSFVNAAVDCHLRVSAVNQQRKNKKVCRLCEVHDDIEVYESLIFHFVKDEIKAAKGSKIRAAITSEEEKKLEEKGVYLLQDQRKGNGAETTAVHLYLDGLSVDMCPYQVRGRIQKWSVCYAPSSSSLEVAPPLSWVPWSLPMDQTTFA